MAVVVIVGAQWGDEGKGKIVDVLAERADFVVRFQGGDNAGHTVVNAGKKQIFHILPSGLLHPQATCVLCGGVVINLKKLLEELQSLSLSKSDWSRRLLIGPEAHLILPCHIAMDKYAESCRGERKIGTTLRGIGPAYADRTARIGVRIADTLDPDYFRSRLKVCLESKRVLLPDKMAKEVCDLDKVAEEQLSLAGQFANLLVDTGALLERARRDRKHILFEGAQGTMLDIAAGTYPYVTSSHTTAGSVCVGCGVGPHFVDTVIGVTKAYATRVGEGPFPTELKGNNGELLRKIGEEYGATTHRARRCGWLDLVQLRRAVRLNGLDFLAVLKLDVFDSLDKIGVCTAYRLHGTRLQEMPINPTDFEHLEPEYEFLPGWQCSTTGITVYDELPLRTREFIMFIERTLNIPVIMISVGKSRLQLIMRRNPFLNPK